MFCLLFIVYIGFCSVAFTLYVVLFLPKFNFSLHTFRFNLDKPVTKEYLKSTLEVYLKEYYNFTINDISKLTDIRIEKNKRNGRKQKEHIKLMNYKR